MCSMDDFVGKESEIGTWREKEEAIENAHISNSRRNQRETQRKRRRDPKNENELDLRLGFGD